MKKIYTMAAIIAATTSIFAQSNMSFEASEGYIIGDINGQNGWEVTINRNDQPIKNQFISNEKASHGVNSIKIDVDLDENFGMFPMFGASKKLSASHDYNNLKIEFDALVTKLDGSSFDFGAWGEEDEAYVPIAYFAFNAIGKLETVKSIDYEYEDTGFTWQPNKWYKLKAEVTANTIKYYVDNVLVHTGDNFSKTNLLGLTFVHDNFEGVGYIDNIKINDTDLTTYEALAAKGLKTYPNPAKDFVEISSPDTIAEYSIYNMAGQKVLSGNKTSKIDIKSLPKGNYILQVKTDNNKTLSTKLIKN